MLPLLSDSLTDDNENFGKKSLVVVTNVIVEWIKQERRPAFLLGFLEGIRVLGSLEGFSNKIVYLCITLDLQRQTETEIEMVNLQ